MFEKNKKDDFSDIKKGNDVKEENKVSVEKQETCCCHCHNTDGCDCGENCHCCDSERDGCCKCNTGCHCDKKASSKCCKCEKEKDEISNLKAQLAEWQNRYLRAYADAENTKRRADIDAKNLLDYKISAFAKDMIPMADNLALAIASVQNKVDESVIVGLKSVLDGFVLALKNNGILKIEAVGKKFNPAEHRVVSQKESDGYEGLVLEEMQAGYKIGDKVIREAMVVVSSPKK